MLKFITFEAVNFKFVDKSRKKITIFSKTFDGSIFRRFFKIGKQFYQVWKSMLMSL